MACFPTDSIDLILTSPPYYNAREYSQYTTPVKYYDEMEKIFTAAYRVLKPSRMCVVVISPVIIPRKSRAHSSKRLALPFYFVPLMEKIGYEFLDDIIWVKPEYQAKNRTSGFNTHRKPVAYKPNPVTEYILVFKKQAPFLIDKILKNHSLVTGDYERSNVWEIPADNLNTPCDVPGGVS